jgi:DNA-binding transcriptional regulator YdaS (Cro superfamily)
VSDIDIASPINEAVRAVNQMVSGQTTQPGERLIAAALIASGAMVAAEIRSLTGEIEQRLRSIDVSLEEIRDSIRQSST